MAETMHATEGGQQKASKELDYTKQFDEIQKLLNCPESKIIFNSVKGEDITVFIGNTRSGKSTLVNFAIGNQLKAVETDVWPCTLNLVKANDSERGPIIGLESVSETTLPSVWSAPRLGLGVKVVDAPGFEDNRGVAQDVANTFYIKEIIRNAKSVKVVLITDLNDITSQNISHFTDFMDKIHRIFPEISVLHGGIALVFSKAGGNATVGHMCRFFEKKILGQKELKVEKSLIKYFTDHKECITFFKMPLSEGPISEVDVDGGILEIIKNTLRGVHGKSLSNVKPGISDKSKAFLLETYSALCNGVEYVELLRKIHGVFNMKCIQLSNAESAEESLQINETVLRLENQVLELFPQRGSGLDFNDVLEKLTSLCNICGIINHMESSNIAVHIKFVEFLDQIINHGYSKVYITKLQGTLKEINNLFVNARIIHAKTLKKITDLEAEKLRREQAEKHNQEMKDLLVKMAQQHKESEEIASKQKETLGIFGKCAKFGKGIAHNCSEFAGGVFESAGEQLDKTVNFFSGLLPF